MKHLFLLLALFGLSLGLGAQTTDAFTAGNTAYAQGDFAAAVSHYEAALAEGNAPGIQANLASAQAQMGNWGDAILHIEKAVAMAPADPLYQEKRTYIYSQANLPAPKLPIWAPHAHALPLNEWAILVTLGGWLVLLGLVLPAMRWLPPLLGGTGVAVGMAMALASIPPLLYYHFQSQRLIVREAAALRVAPTDESPTLAPVRVGESVRRLETHGGFIRVGLSDGSTGYLTSIEVAAIWE